MTFSFMVAAVSSKGSALVARSTRITEDLLALALNTFVVLLFSLKGCCLPAFVYL